MGICRKHFIWKGSGLLKSYHFHRNADKRGDIYLARNIQTLLLRMRIKQGNPCGFLLASVSRTKGNPVSSSVLRQQVHLQMNLVLYRVFSAGASENP